MSASPPKRIRDLTRAFILEQLELYYGERPPAGSVECDYSIWQCLETGLEFAWPMRPGNTCFYEWLSGFTVYYPDVRWEYGEVRRRIESGSLGEGSSLKVLDVGCGKGDFLRGLSFIPADHKFALDLNEPAVQVCRQHGLQAFCGTMETAIKAGFVKKSEFPVVTSFHCMEHVVEPVDFVRSLTEVTVPGGRVFLSTPYSPMSFESDWFDILNHPPHHLTRWNLEAYKRLASVLGVKMRFFFPPSSAIRRTWDVFRLRQYGPIRRVSKVRMLGDLLRHMPTLARLYGKQRERGHKDAGIAANVILVELMIP